MARGVAALAGREDLADLTIICQGQEIKCNRIVLAVMSEVFEAALTSDMAEVKENKLSITDASPASVKEMVKCLYTGNLSSNIRVEELLQLAEKYSVGSLKKACERSLLEDLGVENSVNTLILVERYNCSPQLRSNVLMFFKQNVADIVKTDDWTTALKSGSYAGLFTELFVFVTKK